MADGYIESEFYREMGAKIEAKRKQRGIAQQNLAAEVGVHRNTMMRWESGDCPVPAWMLLRIADILECSHVLLLPSREYAWGQDLQKLVKERDPGKKSVQSERDPIPLKRMEEIA